MFGDVLFLRSSILDVLASAFLSVLSFFPLFLLRFFFVVVSVISHDNRRRASRRGNKDNKPPGGGNEKERKESGAKLNSFSRCSLYFLSFL